MLLPCYKYGLQMLTAFAAGGQQVLWNAATLIGYDRHQIKVKHHNCRDLHLTDNFLILLGLPVLQCVNQGCLVLLTLWYMVKDIAFWPAILACRRVSRLRNVLLCSAVYVNVQECMHMVCLQQAMFHITVYVNMQVAMHSSGMNTCMTLPAV